MSTGHAADRPQTDERILFAPRWGALVGRTAAVDPLPGLVVVLDGANAHGDDLIAARSRTPAG